MNEFSLIAKVIYEQIKDYIFDDYKSNFCENEIIVKNCDIFSIEGLEYLSELCLTIYPEKELSLTKLREKLAKRGFGVIVSKMTHYLPIYFFIVDFLTHKSKSKKFLTLHPNIVNYIAMSYSNELMDEVLKEPFFDSVKKDLINVKQAFNRLALFYLLMYRIYLRINPINQTHYPAVIRYTFRKLTTYVVTKAYVLFDNDDDRKKFFDYVMSNPHRVVHLYMDELKVIPEDMFGGISFYLHDDFTFGLNKNTVYLLHDSDIDSKILKSVLKQRVYECVMGLK